MIFAGNSEAASLPYSESLHATIGELLGPVLYCVSVAVSPEYQQKGLASGLIDRVLMAYPNYYYVSDVSNCDSLTIYKKRNYKIEQLDNDYFMVIHSPVEPIHSCSFSDFVDVIVPDVSVLTDNKIEFTVKKEIEYLLDRKILTGYGIAAFHSQLNTISQGTVVTLSYSNLLKFQRLINVSHYRELFVGDCVYYELNIPYTGSPLMNDILKEMVPSRSQEWGIVPDVFISIPVEYTSLELIKATNDIEDYKSKQLLKDLDFRTHYEAGIPASTETVDDLSCFKHRIRRYYLGKVSIQISSEVTVDHYDGTGDPIGSPALVDMYISVDKHSNCGVLSLYSLSAPFLISHLLDNTIRNQLLVILEYAKYNLFDYVNQTFGIIKRGSPKIFAVIPENKGCLSESQIASLLAAETIYPDGENFGEIIDPDIVSAVSSEKGMGQYDRAFVCAYTNVVLQFTPGFHAPLCERLSEESITLFYIELIILEEAAIHIADRSIITLFTSRVITEPIDFLKQVDIIYDNYSRTIDFWDIQVNYPTSQKSINMLRDAFKIKDQLEFLHRNQAQLQTVFDTKCDIVDRKDAKRMDTSLAIISVLAVFSAWIDGHDYIATWSDIFSPSVIYIIQKVLFIVVLFTAWYAVLHLFGNKFSLFSRIRREKNRKRNKRQRK